MSVMARKKPSPPTNPTARKAVPTNVAIQLDEHIRGAFQRFMDRQRIPPTAPAVLLQLLVEFLEREGCFDTPGDTGTS